MTKVKIFIASSGELEAERKESSLIIIELAKQYPYLRLEPVLFEFDTPSGNVQFKDRIQDGINPKLDESHIVVVLFYSKAGEFTIEELELALSQEKKVFVFFKDGFIAKTRDELSKYDKVLELREKMEKESRVRYQPYKTVAEYNGLLYKDLLKYINDTWTAPADAPEVTTSTSLQRIPLAPRPYLAHPYSIVKNFTGRREDMNTLTEWLRYDKEPMCVVEAIGGMGKSALCWRWLQDEVIATDTKVAGIVWWSFYDQGFEDFIHHMYEYCIPEEVRKLPQRIDETTEVIRALMQNRFLLVLDGFERVLRGYAQMMAMYIQEEGLSPQHIDALKEKFDILQRTPITPKAEKLLRALCSANTKTLMTTRLYPATIEGLAGIKPIKLTGLSKTDTIAFFKTEGIAGTDEDMVRAGAVYGYHPLMLKLLSSSIKRSFTKNIKRAFSGNLSSNGLIDEKEPQKILATSYQLLNQEEQKVVSTLSVFRTAFTFDAAKALFLDIDAGNLEQVMMELHNLGFILYNEQQSLFDFHPILRSYLYNGLTSKDKIHELAITYFNAFPTKEKITTLADLEPVVEQYHHLARAEKYNDAYALYVSRLHDPLFYQLAQYNLCINLCNQLFALSSDSLPQLSKVRSVSFILNELALCYANIGQLSVANEFWIKSILSDFDEDDNSNLSVVLQNLVRAIYVPNGKLYASMVLSMKAETLAGEDKFSISTAQYTIAVIRIKKIKYLDGNIKFLAKYLNETIKYFSENHLGVASFLALEHTKLALIEMSFYPKKMNELLIKAMQWSLKAINYAEQYRVSDFPIPMYFLNGYEALGRSLISIIQYKVTTGTENEAILFYDEHFQRVTDKTYLVPENYTTLAERCIHEGLMLNRKINRVYNECDFLLLLTKIEWLKIRDKQKGIEHLAEVEKILIETYALAIRIEYRILLADLHLCCADILAELQQLGHSSTEKLLNLTAKEHLTKAREFAKDTSVYEDLFLPEDTDEFYKDIPEYEMLKRGLTEDERIKNGYYAAWLRAEQLEKKL